LSALHLIEYWTLLESMYVVMLAAGHVRLVAVGSMLVELVVEEDDVVTGEDVRTVDGVTVTIGVRVDVVDGVVAELGFLVVIGDVDIALLISGQVAPGLQGSTEQQPLNPFWQT
jgi:hypothetical protein